jgi:hypothetical protein
MFFLEFPAILSYFRFWSKLWCVFSEIAAYIYEKKLKTRQTNEVHNFSPTACSLMFVHNMIQAPVYTPFAHMHV